MLIDEEVGVQNRISKLVDISCFGVFQRYLGSPTMSFVQELYISSSKQHCIFPRDAECFPKLCEDRGCAI